MSDQAAIGYEDEDGRVRAVYCHGSGEIAEAGQILHKCHNSIKAAKKIVSKGNLSRLGKHLNPGPGEHSFDRPQQDVSVFYWRDRQEPKEMLEITTCVEDYRDLTLHQYVYLYTNDKWYVSINQQGFVPLHIFFEVDWIARR